MTTGTQSPSHRSSLKVTCRIFCFLQREMSSTAGSVAQVAGRDTRGARAFAQTEIKRHRQGLRRDELSSSDVLDVTVFNLGNLARQSIQRQAEPRMLRLIVNQTSHIMMLVEGTSLSVSQWDQKLREANWTLGSSDDHHHWVGVRTASSGTSITKLVNNCGSEHQKIGHAVFNVKLGYTSNRIKCGGWPECLPSDGSACSSRRCPHSLPFLQNQLCRLAGSVCPLPS